VGNKHRIGLRKTRWKTSSLGQIIFGNNIYDSDFRPCKKAHPRRTAAFETQAPINIDCGIADVVEARFVFLAVLREGQQRTVERQGYLAAVGVASQVQIDVAIGQVFHHVWCVIQKDTELVLGDSTQQSFASATMRPFDPCDVEGLTVFVQRDAVRVETPEAGIFEKVEVRKVPGVYVAGDGELADGGLELREGTSEVVKTLLAIECVAGEDDDIRLGGVYDSNCFLFVERAAFAVQV